MNPTLGRWLKQCTGEDAGPPSAQPVLGLEKSLDKLIPEKSKDFMPHTAEDDAQMTRLIYIAAMGRVRELSGSEKL